MSLSPDRTRRGFLAAHRSGRRGGVRLSHDRARRRRWGSRARSRRATGSPSRSSARATRGSTTSSSFLKDERVQIVAVCDVNRESAGYWDGKVGGREPAKRLVEEHYAADRRDGTYRGCEAYVDYREVLGRADIDAVEVCTPDHWHAIPVIAACKAGKDIYCQKPLSLTIAEGRAMSYAVNKSGVVFQTGSQQRSDWRFRRACELVRNGRIGKLKPVRVGHARGPDRLRQDGRPQEARAGPQGLRLRPLAGPAPRGRLCTGPLPRQLPLDLRLLGRPGHRLGRPPSRLRPVGHGHRDDRPGRDPQRQGRLPARPALEHGDRVLLRGRLRERRDDASSRTRRRWA